VSKKEQATDEASTTVSVENDDDEDEELEWEEQEVKTAMIPVIFEYI